MRSPRLLVISMVLTCSAVAFASLMVAAPRSLTELVAASPVIVLAKPSKKPPQVRNYPIERAPANTPPYERTSAAFDVVKVLRGRSELAGTTVYVDMPNWELYRGMQEAFVRKDPVPSPVVAQYSRDPKSKIPADGEQILFLRPSRDGAYEEAMLDAREVKEAMPRVVKAIKAAPVPE